MTSHFTRSSTESAAKELPIGTPVDPSRAFRPQRVVITGRVTELVPLDPSTHGSDLYEATRGAERDSLWLYLSDGPFSTREGFDEYLSRHSRSEDPLFFAIVDRRSRKAIGFAAYLHIDQTHKSIEVGHVLFTPLLQRTVGATEAMYLMACHVFEDLGYRRYEWKCDALNAGSRAAALRLGFTYEGLFRQHMIVKGRNRDSAWFSMLDCQWPARKYALERWLDPENFDDRGRQRRRLFDFMHSVGAGKVQ